MYYVEHGHTLKKHQSQIAEKVKECLYDEHKMQDLAEERDAMEYAKAGNTLKGLYGDTKIFINGCVQITEKSARYQNCILHLVLRE